MKQYPTETKTEWEYGPCHICGKTYLARNLMFLPYKKPDPYAFKGWGCRQCDLEKVGAISLVCDICLEEWAGRCHMLIKYIFSFSPYDKLVIPIDMFGIGSPHLCDGHNGD